MTVGAAALRMSSLPCPPCSTPQAAPAEVLPCACPTPAEVGPCPPPGECLRDTIGARWVGWGGRRRGCKKRLRCICLPSNLLIFIIELFSTAKNVSYCLTRSGATIRNTCPCRNFTWPRFTDFILAFAGKGVSSQAGREAGHRIPATGA